MRDDAWHEDAYDRDGAHAEIDRVELDARYGRPDPRENDWTWTDVGVGWVAGLVALLTVGVGQGIWLGVVHGDPASILRIPLFMLVPGAAVLAIYGIPVSILLATVLRPVRSEIVHLAVFVAKRRAVRRVRRWHETLPADPG